MENQEIIFGRNPVIEYIRQSSSDSGAALYVSENAHGKIIGIIINHAKEKKIKVEICSKDHISAFVKGAKHQGVVLIPSRSSVSKAEDKPDIDTFLKTAAERKGVLVLLDQLTDPHNIGSIIRTAEALGGRGVILTKANSSGITGSVIKTSAGATAYLPVYTVANAAGLIDKAKSAGFWIIGSSDKGDTDIEKLKELKPLLIIIGSEGTGMRRLTQEKCDYVVSIPLRGNISSLNASVAAGIILFETLKE
ncbi:MAG: 23S rRNA (guanosine(2251)-2'-O)-methyltransferase RlmB [Spirochaetes bacterium]|nr:23S rRNA (guanosine(2251)-2'-O)-methyltransferase RlmB [Spirochaetota bacterium]